MVATTDFEGPLALLLELVERRQLEITDISIAAITADYVEHLGRLSSREPENLSEFLHMGARLVYIKSLALLPQEAGEEQADELRQLNQELAEYRRYQQAARELERLAAQGSWTRPVVNRLEPSERELPAIGLEQLASAFQQALRRAQPERPSRVLRSTLTQEAALKRLRSRLRQGPVELQHLLDEARDRLEIVVTFLATLELVKQGEVRVVQDGQFAPVIMEPVAA